MTKTVAVAAIFAIFIILFIIWRWLKWEMGKLKWGHYKLLLPGYSCAIHSPSIYIYFAKHITVFAASPSI